MAAAVLSPVTALHDKVTSSSPPSTPSSSRVINDNIDWETKYHEVSELLQETRAELGESPFVWCGLIEPSGRGYNDIICNM